MEKAFVEKNVICAVNGWQRRQPLMSRRSAESRSMMITGALIGDDRDGVDGPRLTTLRRMIEEPASWWGVAVDLWNARRESQLESGQWEAGVSNPSRLHGPTRHRSGST